MSSTSVFLSWLPPPTETINGEHLGYRVAYRRHPGGMKNMARTSEDVREIVIRDPEASEFELSGLRPFTRYLVSVQIINPEGIGPANTVEVSTDEGGEEVFQFHPTLFQRRLRSFSNF